MLEGDCAQGDVEKRIEGMTPCAPPLEGEREFLALTGVTPTGSDDQRRYARFHFRRKALVQPLQSIPRLVRRERTACVYVRDISKQGIGFLYDEQLFPGEHCKFLLPELGERFLEVASCHKFGPGCYLIGACFRLAADSASST
jgi:hypothetical protein